MPLRRCQALGTEDVVVRRSLLAEMQTSIHSRHSLYGMLVNRRKAGMSTSAANAIVQLQGDDVFYVTTPSGHALTLDTDSVRNSAASPMELLLVALGCCTAVDVVSILRKKRQEVTDYRVEVRGERREEHPRSFKRMEVHHIVTGRSVSEQSVAQAIQLSEQKYCSVAATLRPTVAIVSSYEIIEA